MLTRDSVAREENNEINSPQIAEKIEVIYYTDPLCSWSWAFEAQWRRLRYEFGEQLTWRYAMGGLIPNWQQFSDPINDIHRPIQMCPQWIQVRDMTEMPLDETIWVEDPPASSYPACIAVKAAQMQGSSIAEVYLRRLREAVMLEKRNISRREVLLELATELVEGCEFDLQRFQADLDSQEVLTAFREDLKDVRYRDIGRFPALVLRPTAGRAVLMVGYRPYEVLREAIAKISPQTQPLHSVTDVVSYVSYWERVTAIEVAVALDMPLQEAQKLLEDAVATGSLVERDRLFVICR